MSTLVLSPSTFTHPTAKWTPESIARRDDASFVVTWRVEYRGGAERGQTVIHASPEERDAVLSACVADIQATRRAVLDPAVQQQSWGGLTTQRQAEVATQARTLMWQAKVHLLIYRQAPRMVVREIVAKVR